MRTSRWKIPVAQQALGLWDGLIPTHITTPSQPARLLSAAGERMRNEEFPG